MTIDWSNAPEGATHFLPEQRAQGWVACWYKNVDGTWFGRNSNDCDWYPDNDYVDEFVPLLMKKPTGEWNGEGLPPVGADIEWCGCRGGYWVPAKVVATNADQVVVQHAQGQDYKPGCFDVWSAAQMKFRPIRTPEQIAAEEREKAIDELTHGYGNEALRGWAIYAYDTLGYRKQVTE